MTWLASRSTAEEWMDLDSTPEAFASALVDLARVNRLTLAYRPTLRWLDRLVARTGARSLSILDVGAGGGDMLLRVGAWAARRGVSVALTGLDRSEWAAAPAGFGGDWITCDLFALDPVRRFDVVICSLFTHHLRDPALVAFLRWIEARSVMGWMISDIHRHPVPWVAIWLAVRALRMDPMVVHDSTVSIARAFSRADWRRVLGEAGVAAEVRWEVPFRWSVSAIR